MPQLFRSLPHTIPTLAGTNMISVVKSQNRFVLLWSGCWMLIAAKEREVAAASAVTEECERMIASADLLLASDENPALIKEISPWLIQFKLLGEYGREVLCMLAAQCDGKRRNWRKPLLMPRPSRY